MNASAASLRELEDRIVALSEGKHIQDARAPFLRSLDNLLPPASISVTECAIRHRKLKGPDGRAAKWLPDRTPYVVGIQDACDEIGVDTVAVQGNARSGKTVGAENLCLRNWIYGPSLDVMWYMQSKDDLEDYVEERVEWMLAEHEQVSAKIDWKNRRQSRRRKRIGRSLARWLAASKSSTRGKAAPIIVADEIDGYQRAVRNAIQTLLKNRQREFGTAALLYVCSHPDAGPSEGIAKIIADGLRHDWWAHCLSCGKSVAFAQGARHRMEWNVPALLKKYEGIEATDVVEQIKLEARLVCPHCKAHFNDEQRLQMSNAGQWLQPGQHLNPDGTVTGPRRIAPTMGFVIHAMMSPFVKLGELAGEWASAKLHFSLTGDDTNLKEVCVKSLGEIYEGTSELEKTEAWEVVRTRLRSNYLLKTVPDGCDFLTAFVDVQGDRFEVVVIGWSALGESWLIDRFSLQQWPGFKNLDPANRLADWRIIEEAVLKQSYPLASAPNLHLPIARCAVDTGGGAAEDGDGSVTQNARLWAMATIGRTNNPVPEYRILLTKGDAHKNGELYGKPRKGMFDDHGKPRPGAPWERTLNVHEIKRIIIKRMKIAEPGPGRMNIPLDLEDKYIRELCAEQLINETWVALRKRNETWDGWVACDAARASLAPERITDWSRPPVWARPFEPETLPLDSKGQKAVSVYSRLAKMNRAAQE